MIVNSFKKIIIHNDKIRAIHNKIIREDSLRLGGPTVLVGFKIFF